jgi:hypothetical protein
MSEKYLSTATTGARAGLRFPAMTTHPRLIGRERA